MKIVFISDTHNQKPNLPDGDLLIHCGDLTLYGTPNEVKSSVEWLGRQKDKYKHGVILSPGNHDFLFEENLPGGAHKKGGVIIVRNPQLAEGICKDNGVMLLNHKAITINGVKIFASPYTIAFCNWAFNVKVNDLEAKWAEIPEDVELLVTHGPPWGILDYCPNGHVGDSLLLNRIVSLQNLKMHAFGHIHESAGYTMRDNKLFLNASVLDGQYLGFNPIQVVEWPTLTVERVV